MSPILGIWASSFAQPTGDYQAIMTATVDSGGASSITFSSIPSTYKHLQIRAISRNSTAATSDNWSTMFINGDTTSTNYYMHAIYGSGSTAAAEASNNNYPFITLNNNNTANAFAATVIDILDYTDISKYKTLRTLNGWDANGSGYIRLLSGLWKNTSAITSIAINAGTNNFTQYSQFALYGVKG